MPSASNLTPESRFCALFVGPKHSGKTSAACSFYTNKRVKVLDGDGRIRGLLGCPWIDRSKIDYDYYPPKLAGVNGKTFFERVNQDLESLLVPSQLTQYETYVSDSATAFCRNLVLDAIPLTHQDGKGKKIGTLNMAGPADYGFESTGMDAYLSFLRSLPINVIVTAHVVDRYGKSNPEDPYSESIIIGEKLSLRDKINANITIYFDNIFRFDRKMVNGSERFFVQFISDIACTSLPNLKPGSYDITGLNFHDFLMKQTASSQTQKENGTK